MVAGEERDFPRRLKRAGGSDSPRRDRLAGWDFGANMRRPIIFIMLNTREDTPEFIRKRSGRPSARRIS
jgi:hypothetical protein